MCIFIHCCMCRLCFYTMSDNNEVVGEGTEPVCCLLFLIQTNGNNSEWPVYIRRRSELAGAADRDTPKEAGQNVLFFCLCVSLSVCPGVRAGVFVCTFFFCKRSVVHSGTKEWMRIKEWICCVRVRVHTCACTLLNEVFDASFASCSEASGACAGAEMDAANFSISVRISECVRGGEGRIDHRGRSEGKTKRERVKIRNREKKEEAVREWMVSWNNSHQTGVSISRYVIWSQLTNPLLKINTVCLIKEEIHYVDPDQMCIITVRVHMYNRTVF